MDYYYYNQTVLLDFKYLEGNNRQTIVKELAIHRCDSIETEMYYFKPPFCYNELTFLAKQRNNYCYTNINKLCWNNGTTPYDELGAILEALENENLTVLVHNVYKYNFIRKFISNVKVIEDFPMMKSLKKYIHNCALHPNSYPACSFLSVYRMNNYLLENNKFL